MADVRVGISGWRYPPWRGVFYPPGLPQRRELEYVAERLRTVEINGSFYSLQRPSSYRQWAAETPDDFLFAVKGGRFVTHLRRLRGVETALANFFASGLLALGPRLGPILWQLPPTTTFDADVVGAFLALLPDDTRAASALAHGHDEKLKARAWMRVDENRPLRHAVEARHDSFRNPEFAALARRHGVAVVVADTAGRWPLLDEPTADFMYVRLHGDVELYTSGYDEPALDRWAARVRGWADEGLDVLVYFDNDVKVRAPFDAMSLAARLRLDAGAAGR
jgi:uncharacterized protein YecE (DUF72 family)